MQFEFDNNVMRGSLKNKPLAVANSLVDDFWSNNLTLFGPFLDRGYPDKLLAKSLIKASNQERDKLLQTKPKETKEEMEEKLLFAITTFFPNYPILKSSILDVWHLMGKSPTTNYLFDRRIIFGNRRLKTYEISLSGQAFQKLAMP